jgi:16S rRNA (adenine1518-N6/adenine1519-N6)-dimethyltransferase
VSGPRDLLGRYGLRAKKSWGQNFLVDRGVLERIVRAAAPSGEDTVIEIGAGTGALTAPLAAAAGRVVAVERDPEMVAVLERELGAAGNVVVAAEDAVAFDFARAAHDARRPIVVVGNLPYQITSPLLFAIVGAAAGGRTIARAVLMIQREVAERIVAGPGSKTYGRLSVMIQQAAEVELLFHVGARSFHPRPAVTSTVIRVVPRAVPLAPVRDPALFAETVRAAFGARRKMLRGALAPAFGEERARAALAAAGVDGARRAEELAIADFARLADALESHEAPRA